MQLFLYFKYSRGEKMPVLVSIIVPVYNAAQYLEACLDSVVKQKYQTFEVIVINDGSTDNSEEIIRKYTNSDKRFKLYNQENHGLGYTRNKGIELSQGKYIFFLDADDFLPVSSIERLVNSVVKNDADYGVGKVMRYNGERYYVPIRHNEFKLYQSNIITTLQQNPEILQDSIACNKLWNKKFLVDNNLLFTEGKLYEDLIFTMKAAVLAKKISVINKAVYYWRIRDDENGPSITQQQMKLSNTRDRITALTAIRLWLIESNVDRKILEEHDLKSLLDIIRLHVYKYALIPSNEKQEWHNEMASFLEKIPPEASDKLTGVEKVLYDLLINKNFEDLLLFSQMYTNTETEKIIEQQGNSFYLLGSAEKYEVTKYLKPRMKIGKIEVNKNAIKLSGELTIPKATFKTIGLIYMVNRNTKRKIKIASRFNLKQNSKSLYPYENGIFDMVLTRDMLKGLEEKETYDFYFVLQEDEQHLSSRVIYSSKVAANSYSLEAKHCLYSFYRTKNGNFSVKVIPNSVGFISKMQVLSKKILKKLKSLI